MNTIGEGNVISVFWVAIQARSVTNRGTGLDWTVQQDVDGTGLYSKTSTGLDCTARRRLEWSNWKILGILNKD